MHLHARGGAGHNAHRRPGAGPRPRQTGNVFEELSLLLPWCPHCPWLGVQSLSAEGKPVH